MLVDKRRIETPTLDAGYEHVDFRFRHLRVVRVRSRNIANDWGLLDRALPFTQRAVARTNVSIVLDGAGRFDEARRHAFLEEGAMAVSSQAKRGTEAYAGRTSPVVAIEWDPAVYGASHDGGVAIEALSPSDLARVRAIATELDGPKAIDAIASLLGVLRANGLSLDHTEVSDDRADPQQNLQHALSIALSKPGSISDDRGCRGSARLGSPARAPRHVGDARGVSNGVVALA